MNLKRSQAFVQMVCALTRLADSAVNPLRDSATMTYCWSAKVIWAMSDLIQDSSADITGFSFSDLLFLLQHLGVDHQID